MKNTKPIILLTEDDPLTLQTNKRILSEYGSIYTARNRNEAEKLIEEKEIDVAFFDLNLQGKLDGLRLIEQAFKKNIYSIVVSGESREEVLKEAFMNGAKDYLIKPFDKEKLNLVMNRFLNSRRYTEFDEIIHETFITKSQTQKEELYKLKNLILSDRPIFVHGETGTGKRVIGHLIKKISGSGEFLELNCSQFSDELIASELFGHVKGAFTGAVENKTGLLEKANNGILFLDEIHALSIRSQKTLLKAIEEKEFYPVGSNKTIKSNFRVVSATCEDIQDHISSGHFRSDLFARISTFQINLLPLRDRKEDIDALFEYFISKHLVQVLITSEAKAILRKYSWPRNTREIQDLVENWIVNGQRLITTEILPNHIRLNITQMNHLLPDAYFDFVEEHGLTEFLIFLKKEIAQSMIKRNGGSMRKASKVMQVSHSNLCNFLKQNKSKSLYAGGR